MPLQKCSGPNGEHGVRWGNAGKCYTYDLHDEQSKKDAISAAMKQAIAMGDESQLPHEQKGDAASMTTTDELANRALTRALKTIEEREALPGSIDAAESLETETEAQENAVPLCDQLVTLLGNVASFYWRAHASHWNVTGTDFSEFHALFEAIYSDVYESIDPLAENILKLGYSAPANLAAVIAVRDMPDTEAANNDPSALATMLLTANADILDDLDDAYQRASAEEQQGIATFLADRIDMHSKWSWQLRASLGLQPQGDEMDVAPDADDQMMAQDDAMRERSLSPVRIQYRDSGAGANYRTITGYASVFNRASEDLGGFREIIAPGAFRNALANDAPVALLYDHDTASVLASTKNGSLELREDETGLRVWARVDMADPDVQRVASKLRSGIVDQMSFAFTVGEESWDYTESTPVRTIRSVESLYECSIVCTPAYTSTKVEMLDRARTPGRLPAEDGAADAAHDNAGGESRSPDTSDAVIVRAAHWRARYNLLKQKETLT